MDEKNVQKLSYKTRSGHKQTVPMMEAVVAKHETLQVLPYLSGHSSIF